MPASAAVWLADEAVYRSTLEGRRELACDSGRLDGVERRFLGVVTGRTPLRVLIDLGLPTPGVGRAVCQLIDLRMIELVEPADVQASVPVAFSAAAA